MSEDAISKLGDMVRNARKAQGLTQESLASMCGVGIRFIRELEQGKASCHMGKAFHVLAMLGLDVRIDGETL